MAVAVAVVYVFQTGSPAVSRAAGQAASGGPPTVIPDLNALAEPGVRAAATTGQDVGRGSHHLTVVNGDGSLTTAIGVRPLFWREPGSGDWQDFDNGIAAKEDTPGFRFGNGSSAFSARFADAETVRGGGALFRFGVRDTAVTVTPVGASPSEVVVGEAGLAYTDLFPGADLRLTVDNERLKEDLIIDAAPATALTFVFLVQLDGVTHRGGRDGGIEFLDGRGSPRFGVPRLVMTDSAPKPAVSRVALTTSRAPGGDLLVTLAPDAAWLADPARVYPVSIDPTLQVLDIAPLGAQGENVTIDDATPTTNYYADPTLKVGMNASSQRRDALLKFNALDALPRDATVSRATLTLTATSGSDAVSFEVRSNNAAFDDTTVTWNSAPAFGTMVWGTGNLSAGAVSNVDVSGLVRGWLRGDLANHGMRLRSTSAAGPTGVVRSSFAGCTDCQPVLSVTYVPATRYGRNPLWTFVESEYGAGNTGAVEVSTGNFVLTHTGGSIDARGFNIDLTHTYNSADPFELATYPGAAVYGEGWTFAFNQRLFELDGGNAVVFKDGMGDQSRTFVKDVDAGGNRTYLRPIHFGSTLVKDISSPPADKVWTLTTDAGQVKRFFDMAGKLTRIEDRNGNFLTFGYDGSSRLATITDVASRVTTLEYNGVGGRLSKITDMASRVSTYGYDSAGNLTTIKHGVGSADEVTTTLGYDDGHRMTSVRNPRNHTSQIRYTVIDGWESGTVGDWVAEGTDATLSPSTTRSHGGNASLKVDLVALGDANKVIQKDMNSSPRAFNATAHELMTWVYLPSGSVPVKAHLNLEFVDSREGIGPWHSLTPGAWTAIRFIDAPVEAVDQVREVEIKFAKDGGSNFTGSVWVDDVALRGETSSLTDAKSSPNTILSATYDPDARTSRLARPDSGGTFRDTTYVYDRAGDLKSVTDPLGHTTSYQRDSQLRLMSITPAGVGALPYQFGYYPNSLELQTATNGAGEVTRRGAKTTTGDTRYFLDPLNETRRATGTQTYDATILNLDPATGNVLSATNNRYAASANLENDPFPAPQSWSLSRTVSFQYTTGGLLSRVTNPASHYTAFGYDVPKGYLTSIDAPAGSGEGSRRVTTISRNGDGTVNYLIDPKNQRTEFTYDGLGRLKSIRYGVINGTPAFTVTYTLDPNGNLTGMTDQAGSTTWGYDENNRVTSESRTQNGVTKNAAYTYFANGTLKNITTFASQTVTFGYDIALQLTSQTDPKDANRTITFGYDDRSRRTTITYPSGVKHTQTYDKGDRVKEILLEKANGTDLQKFIYDYGFDANGNRLSTYRFGHVIKLTELDGSQTTFTYDDLARLSGTVRTGTGALTQSFVYDSRNNRTSFTSGGSTTTATYDAANQMVTSGGQALTYDRNGNLTGYGVQTFSYDASNRWTSGSWQGTAVSSTYDGLGRMVSRTAAGVRTDLWYDQTGLVLEDSATDTTLLRDPSGLLLSTHTTAVNNYGRDRLGSITALAATDQTLTNTYRYDAYGSATLATGTAPNNFRFTGAYRHASTGLHLLGQRHYHPSHGRFTQQDPLPSSVVSLNRYVYARCNPANYTDPTGLLTQDEFECGLSFLLLALGIAGVGALATFLAVALAPATLTATVLLDVLLLLGVEVPLLAIEGLLLYTVLNNPAC
jgi:RHS repeat-associated protein